MLFRLFNGDCLDLLRNLDDASIDSIVTDPPYGLSFMGKRWDYDVPSEEIWRECLRVLKPGGHLLSFAGSRTYHRMAVRIEDAGFEIRDQIMWVYGSGFPKSLDVSKAIDKCNGEPDRLLKFTRWMRTTGLTAKRATEALRGAGVISENGTMAGHFFAASQAGQPAIPTPILWVVLRPLCGDVPAWVDDLVERIEAEREVVGHKTVNGEEGTAGGYANGIASLTGCDVATRREIDITAPATDAAKQWQGWGTALKPAHEPIVLARKPLAGTVAANVLAHGTGALNIDGCRVGSETVKTHNGPPGTLAGGEAGRGSETVYREHAGRWPANLIHDGSDEVVGLFPTTGPSSGRPRNNGEFKSIAKGRELPNITLGHDDTGGSAARFFYCAKASKSDRDEGLEGRNAHPTVKPTALMRYLVRLITPPGGTVLDPFTGSGSTGKAAILEGFRFVGAEMEREYYEIAAVRMGHAAQQREQGGRHDRPGDDREQFPLSPAEAGAACEVRGPAPEGEGACASDLRDLPLFAGAHAGPAQD